jgi:hypothetical protein
VRVEYLDSDDSRGPVKEAELRRVVVGMIASVASLDRVKAIPDKAKRAEALRGLLDAHTADLVKEALVACGKDAVPVIERILADEDPAELHFIMVHALEEIGDPSIDDVLIKAIERETHFAKTAPNRETLRRRFDTHRSVISSVLDALQRRKPAACREPLKRLREQLAATGGGDDGFAIPKLREKCDEALRALEK